MNRSAVYLLRPQTMGDSEQMAATSLAMPADSFGKCGMKALSYRQSLTCSLRVACYFDPRYFP